jgi:hypothetical protein
MDGSRLQPGLSRQATPSSNDVTIILPIWCYTQDNMQPVTTRYSSLSMPVKVTTYIHHSEMWQLHLSIRPRFIQQTVSFSPLQTLFTSCQENKFQHTSLNNTILSGEAGKSRQNFRCKNQRRRRFIIVLTTASANYLSTVTVHSAETVTSARLKTNHTLRLLLGIDQHTS